MAAKDRRFEASEAPTHPDLEAPEVVPPWRPSPERFSEYQKREVEMARAALKDRSMLPRSETLFSPQTWAAAGGSDPVTARRAPPSGP